jgi:hypothetical protein
MKYVRWNGLFRLVFAWENSTVTNLREGSACWILCLCFSTLLPKGQVSSSELLTCTTAFPWTWAAASKPVLNPWWKSPSSLLQLQFLPCVLRQFVLILCGWGVTVCDIYEWGINNWGLKWNTWIQLNLPAILRIPDQVIPSHHFVGCRFFDSFQSLSENGVTSTQGQQPSSDDRDGWCWDTLVLRVSGGFKLAGTWLFWGEGSTIGLWTKWQQQHKCHQQCVFYQSLLGSDLGTTMSFDWSCF